MAACDTCRSVRRRDSHGVANRLKTSFSGSGQVLH